MIIIAHRGGAGLASENTLAALAASSASSADILHVDVRLTHDHVPILLHDAKLWRTHKLTDSIGSLTYDRLRKLTNHDCPPRLETVLDKYYSRILLNIELRSRGSGKIVAKMLGERIGKSTSGWDNVLLSSAKVSELMAARHVSRHANLALLQGNNPFAYIAYHRFLCFTAVGFHRLHTNRLALAIAAKADIFTYAYTVDRPEAMKRLAGLGFDGIMTDNPDKMSAWLTSKSHKRSKH